MTYRRRTTNTGFKAGNIRDFCEQWGAKHEFAVSLDADSFMTAEATCCWSGSCRQILSWGFCKDLSSGYRLRALLHEFSSLACGSACAPTRSGVRGGKEIADPYWGHNAVFRLGPFIAHCELPVFSRGGSETRHILSHDQIEAALMRAAGYSVRVLPEEGLGWEENPPTLLEFIRRDLRWCQGNMQYWRFLTMPELSR